jgi:hypothetical protein
MNLEGENPSSEMASRWSVGVKILLKALRDRVLRSDVSALCVLAAFPHRGVGLVGISRPRKKTEEVF